MVAVVVVAEAEAEGAVGEEVGAASTAVDMAVGEEEGTEEEEEGDATGGELITPTYSYITGPCLGLPYRSTLISF